MFVDTDWKAFITGPNVEMEFYIKVTVWLCLEKSALVGLVNTWTMRNCSFNQKHFKCNGLAKGFPRTKKVLLHTRYGDQDTNQQSFGKIYVKTWLGDVIKWREESWADRERRKAGDILRKAVDSFDNDVDDMIQY